MIPHGRCGTNPLVDTRAADEIASVRPKTGVATELRGRMAGRNDQRSSNSETVHRSGKLRPMRRESSLGGSLFLCRLDVYQCSARKTSTAVKPWRSKGTLSARDPLQQPATFRFARERSRASHGCSYSQPVSKSVALELNWGLT